MMTSIAEVARLSGISSRTLRHYDAIGLLPPSHVDAAGRRWYDQGALQRLQRILLLRRFGVGLPRIAEVLADGVSDGEALRAQVQLLRRERERLDRQVAALELTIAAAEEGTELMAEDMLDGFDSSQYRDEVERRWGEEAYQRSDRWWQGLGGEGQQAFQQESAALARDWIAAWSAGLPVAGEQAQALAARHIDWIATAWGGGRPDAEQIRGLAQMYVEDERFAANYGGREGAGYVRDALIVATS